MNIKWIADKLMALVNADMIGMAMPGVRLPERVRKIVEGRKVGRMSRVWLAGVVAACVVICLAFIGVTLTLAQSPETDWEKAAGGHIAFEVESIKRNNSHVSPANNAPRSNFPLDNQEGYYATGGLLSATNYRLDGLIGFAYKLTGIQVNSVNAELPKWANEERFDVEARAEGNPTKDQMRLMMQSLLADRFKLTAHMETRKGAVLALVLAKPGKPGPQLQPHSDDTPCAELPPSAPGAPPPHSAALPNGLPAVCGMLLTRLGPKGFSVSVRNVTVAEFVSDLLGSPINPFDRPVIDHTSTTGRFDMTLQWRSEVPFTFNGVTIPPDDSVPTLLEALKDQLGIKVESTTGDVRSLIVDRIEEPTAN